jgi:DNA (cytosine-5)-methyltransferase 1
MRQALPQKQKLDFIDAPINPTTPRLFTVITTFAGCGGSSLGYKWAGGKVLAAVEWDENAVATYRLNHLGTPVLHRDITTVSAEELLALTGLQPGELDIFDGSPPCQGFSTAGKRQIDDPRNSLFREYVRLLRGLQPKVFIMENVSGMVKGSMKHVFAIAMRELKASGYTVKCQLMDAAYFGVPQHRQRVIFIGVRNDLAIMPSHPMPHTREIGVSDCIPGIIGSRSMKINPWMRHPRAVATITKTDSD